MIIFNSQNGPVEVDFNKMEAYFRKDDLVAKMRVDDLGYVLFEHPMWLTSYRVLKPYNMSNEGHVQRLLLEQLLWKVVGEANAS